MRWVRVHTHFDIWAANGPAPTFCITSDDDGEAYIEIAKRPELLFRPETDLNDMWNCFFSHSGSNDGSVAAASISITNGRADYTLPQAVWEQMRNVVDSDHPEQQGLYYRVRSRPSTGSSEAYISHTDGEIQSGQVPFIKVIPVSGDPSSITPVNDTAALEFLDQFHRDLLAVLKLLPESDPGHKALDRLLTHPTYEGQSSPRIRANILKLFIYAGGNGRQLMQHLLDLRVATSSTNDGRTITEPALFHRDERNEGTTLDHLLALWQVRLNRNIPIALSEVIFEVIQELVDPPGQINQGAAGTCAATSIQTYTIVRNPAEYARWCRNILDRRKGYKVQLANGDWMETDSKAFDVATWKEKNPNANQFAQNFWGRTYSERGIQAAIMDYANFRHSYDPEEDDFENWIWMSQGSGLWPFEISRALEAIFDQSWVFEYGGGSVNSAPNSSAADALFAHFQNGGLPCILDFLWGPANSRGAHAVVGLRVENNRLIFRNPQYRGSVPNGGVADNTNQTNPPRIVDDVSRAEESMTLVDARQWIRGYCRESFDNADRGYTLAEIPSHLRDDVEPTA